MTSPDHPIIDVELVPLPAPMRIAPASFLTTLKECEDQVAALAIADTASAQLAATLQARLTKAGNLLETTRKQLKEPVLEQGRKIDEAAKGPAARIEAAKTAIKRKLAEYDAAQRRIAQEAERKRQEELRRLEEQRAAEEAELARKAAEIAASAPKVEVLDIDGDDGEPEPAPKTETQVAIEKLQHAPVVAPPKLAGVTFRVTLVVEVVDAAKVPEQFTIRTVNLNAIRALYCVGYKDGMPLPVMDGVRFTVVKTAVATGKEEF